VTLPICSVVSGDLGRCVGTIWKCNQSPDARGSSGQLRPGLAARPRREASRRRRRLGITDGSFTEVLEGALDEQQEVITGVTAPGRQPAGSAGGPRLRF
jgi:hypothetical protein